MINWSASFNDCRAIAAITRRAVTTIPVLGDTPFVELEMDITACHCNGCPLDLEKLLNAGEFDFTHDVLGIRRHVSRETGEMQNCFVPRCAVREVAA